MVKMLVLLLGEVCRSQVGAHDVKPVTSAQKSCRSYRSCSLTISETTETVCTRSDVDVEGRIQVGIQTGG